MPKRMFIKDVMRRNVLTVREDTPTMDALRRMKRRGVGAVVVTRGKKPIGIFTDHDVFHKVLLTGKDPEEIPIGSVMTREVVSVSPDSLVSEAYIKMERGNFRHLLVVEGGALAGIVSIKDLIRTRQKLLENLVEEKTEEIRTVSEQLSESLRLLHREMTSAGAFQKRLVARELPAFTRIRFSQVYEQADSLGGDYFEVMSPGSNHIGVFVGDVMGHGITSAFIAMAIKQMLDCHVRDGLGPGALIRRVNQDLMTEKIVTEGFFVAGFYMDLNLRTLRGSYTQFGLPMPGVYRAATGVFEMLHPTEVPIGIKSDAIYSERNIAFSKGDILFLFTDGCSEQKNGKGAQLGEKRFVSDFVRMAKAGTPEIAQKLYARIRRYAGESPITDDIAILLMECT